jgi:hypothetical protein
MTVTSRLPTFTPADLRRLEPVLVELRDYLVGAKRLLEEEIRTYPTPIPRCDAQFNHLYEQRSRLARILDPVGAALDRGDCSPELVDAMAGFTACAPFGESAEEQKLRERLRAELSPPDPALNAPARGPRL